MQKAAATHMRDLQLKSPFTNRVQAVFCMWSVIPNCTPARSAAIFKVGALNTRWQTLDVPVCGIPAPSPGLRLLRFLTAGFSLRAPTYRLRSATKSPADTSGQLCDEICG